MRVIAGTLKGRALASPQSQAIRPSSDRLRESLFNILEHGGRNLVQGARVLDLFAGTGALGIEALSRGGVFGLFVDHGVEARGILRQNFETLGLNGVTKIYKRDARHLGVNPTPAPFDLVFCDPPYNQSLSEQALQSAADGGWLKNNCHIVVEESSSAVLKFSQLFEEYDERKMSDSRLTFLKFSGG